MKEYETVNTKGQNQVRGITTAFGNREVDTTSPPKYLQRVLLQIG